MGSLTFSADSIPDLQQKVFIVTGGNSGLGYETALQLALHNGRVIVATHAQDPNAPMPADEIDGPGAVSKIKAQKADALVEYMELDLASFRSIHRFVEAFKAKGMPLYCLINNSGLQTPPDGVTEDGFEITLGINFWGHFYLTQLLIPLLQQTARQSAGAGTPSSARIVWESSPAETLGETDFDDLKGLKRGTNMKTYGTSKMWMLMVAMELNDRLKATGVESFAAHPGLARTDIFRKADHSKPASVATDWSQYLTGQTAANGALSMLYAATSPDLEGKGGTYYGPYYIGPAMLNVGNTMRRDPGNAEVQDPDQRARLYEAACSMIREVAGNAGVPIPEAMGNQPLEVGQKAAQEALNRIGAAAAAPAGVTA